MEVARPDCGGLSRSAMGFLGPACSPAQGSLDCPQQAPLHKPRSLEERDMVRGCEHGEGQLGSESSSRLAPRNSKFKTAGRWLCDAVPEAREAYRPLSVRRRHREVGIAVAALPCLSTTVSGGPGHAGQHVFR